MIRIKRISLDCLMVKVVQILQNAKRNAYYVCLLIWPWSHTKLPKIQKIIEHYSEQKLGKENPKKGKSADVVDLKEYKMRKEMMFE